MEEFTKTNHVNGLIYAVPRNTQINSTKIKIPEKTFLLLH